MKYLLPLLLVWVVQWEVNNSYLVPCPQPENAGSEYGIESPFTVTNAVACWSHSSTQKSRVFDTEKAADLFIKKMPTCGNDRFFGDSCCSNPIKTQSGD